MSRRYSPPQREDPAVAAVEQLLGPSRRCEADLRRRVDANFALWICNCYGDDLAPIWLVYDRAGDGLIEWCRVPPCVREEELVNAKDMTGDHTFPDYVLAWLQGREADPWGGSTGGGDAVLLKALREKILAG